MSERWNISEYLKKRAQESGLQGMSEKKDEFTDPVQEIIKKTVSYVNSGEQRRAEEERKRLAEVAYESKWFETFHKALDAISEKTRDEELSKKEVKRILSFLGELENIQIKHATFRLSRNAEKVRIGGYEVSYEVEMYSAGKFIFKYKFWDDILG